MLNGRELGVMHHVVLDQQMRGAFVVVNAPAAVVVGVHVVDVVVADDRARRDAERVDAAHVRQHAADVVNVVELDAIVLAHAALVAPHPADRNARVTAVVNMVMGHDVALGVGQQHAHGRRKILAVMVQPVVGDAIVARAVPRRTGFLAASHADATSRQLGEFVTREFIVGAASHHLEAEGAEIEQPALFERARPGAAQRDGSRHGGGPLPVVGIARPEFKIRVGKRQIAETQMLDVTPLRRLAFQAQVRGGERRHHLGLGQILAGQRVVKELASAAVQIPLARRVQTLKDILHDVARAILGEVVREGLPGFVREGDEVRLRVHALDGQVRVGPEVIDDDLDVGEVGPVGTDVAGLELEGLAVLVIVRRLRRAFRAAGHAQVAFVRRAGADALLAVDVELPKPPRAAGHVGHVGHPEFVIVLLPASDAPPAIQHDRLRLPPLCR